MNWIIESRINFTFTTGELAYFVSFTNFNPFILVKDELYFRHIYFYTNINVIKRNKPNNNHMLSVPI
jgi:hypothetical protein